MFLRAAGKFPKLRGKGSEIRHFGKALLSLWSKEMNVHLSLRKKILLMLQLNVELEDTITEYKSPQASRKDLKRLLSDALAPDPNCRALLAGGHQTL